ncbi:Cif family virulence factor [Aquimarina sp. M1]
MKRSCHTIFRMLSVYIQKKALQTKYGLFAFALMIVSSCGNANNKNTDASTPSRNIENLLDEYNQKMIHAAKTKSFLGIRDLYDKESLLMTDYNPLIVNNNNIKIYYDTMFARQNIEEYRRQTVDVLEFTDKIIEIGLFTKFFENSEKLEGKYLNVWKKNTNGKLTLRAEGFGYLQQVDDPTIFLVAEASTSVLKAITIPRELEAYTVLGKSNVIARVPEKTADAYTDDGMYLPFADTIKTGETVLLNHFKAYYRNPATIDSLELMTYAYDTVDSGYIKYGGFYVSWTVPEFSGDAAGTGISYWRREKDNSLRIHRQIGLHTH